MTLETVTNHHQIKEGDCLLIRSTKDADKDKVSFHTVILIQERSGEHEIILSKKDNTFFNLQQHLKGLSWAKEIIIVKP